ncbi:MAG: DUF3387 domain-containing protein, partial [Proteobacteria bacterium]|nr:DUF3387 domain-containing protein [Pseudomonadota bacterium]
GDNWERKEQERLLKRFKKPMDEDGLSLLIVCDMLLTGFDAPIEQAMYLDKPLKEHNLLQAIARVNRPYKEKNHGLIIDYYGVSAFLKQALAVFSKRDVQGALTPLTDELPRLQSRHRAAMRFFEGVNRKDLDACVSVLEPEDVRLKFDVAFRRFAESMDMVMPDPAANPYREDLKFLGMVRNAARNRFRDENINLAGCGEKVRKLINEHIRASGVDPLHKPVSILEKDFEKTIDDIRSDEAKASEMEHAIRHEIRVRIDENPVFYSSLKERLEEIIKDRKKERMALSLAIEEYGKIITEIRGLSKKARSLGLNETEYAFYELLKVELKAKKKAGKEGKAGKPREGEEKNGFAALAKELVSMLGDLAVVDWKTRDDVQRQMRSRIKRKLKSFGCDKDKLDKVTARVMELAKVRL